MQIGMDAARFCCSAKTKAEVELRQNEDKSGMWRYCLTIMRFQACPPLRSDLPVLRAIQDVEVLPLRCAFWILTI
jgi:hypothetical protein